MIYLTGDTHGLRDIDKFESREFLNEINKKGNYVIILGDMGVTWNEKAMAECIEYFGQFKCKFLFIDGNNENFDILNKLPVEKFCGGNVHKVSNNILHLMRGEIFEIEGKSFLAFGGADSWDAERRYPFEPDKWYPGKGNRKAHVNWWREERPTMAELKNALANLQKHDNKVDVILTHETRTENIKNHFSYSITKEVCKMLDLIYKKADFKMWYFGHHHQDRFISKNEKVVFSDFVKVDDMKNIKTKNQNIEQEKNDFSF